MTNNNNVVVLNLLLLSLLLAQYLVLVLEARSIAERPVDLQITYYEIEGAGAGSDNNKHFAAACQSSTQGCRLKFEFSRCTKHGNSVLSASYIAFAG